VARKIGAQRRHDINKPTPAPPPDEPGKHLDANFKNLHEFARIKMPFAINRAIRVNPL
jgi:hypothetical protein